MFPFAIQACAVAILVLLWLAVAVGAPLLRAALAELRALRRRDIAAAAVLAALALACTLYGGAKPPPPPPPPAAPRGFIPLYVEPYTGRLIPLGADIREVLP